MIVYDVDTKLLDIEEFPQHNISNLNSGITFIALFSQKKPLRTVKEKNTRHTHTHTHVYTLMHMHTYIYLCTYIHIHRQIAIKQSLLVREINGSHS